MVPHECQCEVEVDGQWYELMPTARSIQVSELNSGHDRFFSIALYGPWRNKQTHKPLVFEQGERSLRVACSIKDKETQYRLVSAPLKRQIPQRYHTYPPTTQPEMAEKTAELAAALPTMRQRIQSIITAIDAGDANMASNAFLTLGKELTTLAITATNTPMRTLQLDAMGQQFELMAESVKKYDEQTLKNLRGPMEEVEKILESALTWFEAPGSATTKK
jgi:hypothetical protein